jgi:adenylate kinase
MRVLFVGGVHGVGKSSACAKVAEQTCARHFTASTLIREERASALLVGRKEVVDVPGNQELLIRAFWRIVDGERAPLVLLDGHFALRTSTLGIETIPAEVFAAMGVTELVCFVGEPAEIAGRLASRDGMDVDPRAVDELQRYELGHATQVSDSLRLPLTQLEAFDSTGLLRLLG